MVPCKNNNNKNNNNDGHRFMAIIQLRQPTTPVKNWRILLVQRIVYTVSILERSGRGKYGSVMQV